VFVHTSIVGSFRNGKSLINRPYDLLGPPNGVIVYVDPQVFSNGFGFRRNEVRA